MRTYIVITTLIFLMQAASAGAADIPVLDRLPAANGEFAAEVAEAIATLPVDVRRRFAEAGWQIELVEMVVDGAPELLRKRPSGWSKQSVWENADAVHLPSQKRILIATHRRDSSGRRVRTHRVAFVVRHEIGHAVDRIFGEAGKCYSESAAYRASHAADCESMKRSDRQSLDYYARRSSRGESLSRNYSQCNLVAGPKGD